MPSAYRRIGALPVTGETASRSYSSWDFARTVERQLRWNSLPSGTTSAFKAAVDSAKTVTTPGLTDSRSGDRYEARLSAARSFTDEAGYEIGAGFRMDSLAWPALYQVTLHAPRADEP